MKVRNLVLFILGVTIAPALAGEKTLIGDLEDVDHGGFGGPVVKFTRINGEAGVLTGGRGGWIIDHRFVLGGGGYGLANNIEAEGAVPPGQDLEMGYGGGMIEYIIASDRLLHFSVECLIGAGGVTTSTSGWDGSDNREDDAFFVIEPGANAMLNITKFFRFGVGVSYRYIQGVHFHGIDAGDLSGVAAVLTFKFGAF